MMVQPVQRRAGWQLNLTLRGTRFLERWGYGRRGRCGGGNTTRKQWCLNEGVLHFCSISVVGIHSMRERREVTGCQGVITLSL